MVVPPFATFLVMLVHVQIYPLPLLCSSPFYDFDDPKLKVLLFFLHDLFDCLSDVYF